MTLFGEAIGLNVKDAPLKADPLLFHEKILGRTNIGFGRQKNQDALSLYFDDENDKIYMAIADGLGCYMFSERASYEAVLQVPKKVADGLDILRSVEELHLFFLNGHPYNRKGQVPVRGT